MPIISASSGGRRTRLLPFEPSRCDESNGGSLVILPSLDAEIIGKTLKISYFINVLPIISATNNDGKSKLPPIEPSRCNESNGGGFNPLPPLDAEIIGKTSIKWPIL